MATLLEVGDYVRIPSLKNNGGSLYGEVVMLRGGAVIVAIEGSHYAWTATVPRDRVHIAARPQ